MFSTNYCANEWLLTLDSILQRMLITLSYSAVDRGTLAVKGLTLSNELSQWACMLFFILIAFKVQALQGVHKVWIMLAAQSFSSSLPLPQEPSGSLILPSVLMYFGMAATIMTYLQGIARGHVLNDVVEETQQFIILFVSARGLVRFQAMQQQRALGFVSLVYVLLPSALLDAVSPSLFVQIVDRLANRGLVLWLISEIQQFTGLSVLFPNIFFFLSLLAWNPFGKQSTRAQACMDVFALYTTRELIRILQLKIPHHLLCILALLTILIWTLIILKSYDTLFTASVQTNFFFSMVSMGVGMLFTDFLDEWTRGWFNNSIEWILIYFVMLMLLDAASQRLQRAKPSSEVAVHLNIAHSDSLLGLPQVDDAQGAH